MRRQGSRYKKSDDRRVESCDSYLHRGNVNEIVSWHMTAQPRKAQQLGTGSRQGKAIQLRNRMEVDLPLVWRKGKNMEAQCRHVEGAATSKVVSTQVFPLISANSATSSNFSGGAAPVHSYSLKEELDSIHNQVSYFFERFDAERDYMLQDDVQSLILTIHNLNELARQHTQYPYHDSTQYQQQVGDIQHEQVETHYQHEHVEQVEEIQQQQQQQPDYYDETKRAESYEPREEEQETEQQQYDAQAVSIVPNHEGTLTPVNDEQAFDEFGFKVDLRKRLMEGSKKFTELKTEIARKNDKQEKEQYRLQDELALQIKRAEESRRLRKEMEKRRAEEEAELEEIRKKIAKHDKEKRKRKELQKHLEEQIDSERKLIKSLQAQIKDQQSTAKLTSRVDNLIKQGTMSKSELMEMVHAQEDKTRIWPLWSRYWDWSSSTLLYVNNYDAIQTVTAPEGIKFDLDDAKREHSPLLNIVYRLQAWFRRTKAKKAKRTRRWTRQYDADSGCEFFYNPETRESVWELPEGVTVDDLVQDQDVENKETEETEVPETDNKDLFVDTNETSNEQADLVSPVPLSPTLLVEEPSVVGDPFSMFLNDAIDQSTNDNLLEEANAIGGGENPLESDDMEMDFNMDDIDFNVSLGDDDEADSGPGNLLDEDQPFDIDFDMGDGEVPSENEGNESKEEENKPTILARRGSLKKLAISTDEDGKKDESESEEECGLVSEDSAAEIAIWGALHARATPTGRQAGEWVERLDVNSGEVYYYNSGTGEASWEVPKDFARRAGLLKPVSSVQAWEHIVAPGGSDLFWINWSNGSFQVDAPLLEEDDNAKDTPHAEVVLNNSSVKGETATLQSERLWDILRSCSRPIAQHNDWVLMEHMNSAQEFYSNKVEGEHCWEMPHEWDVNGSEPIEDHEFVRAQSTASIPTLIRSKMMAKNQKEKRISASSGRTWSSIVSPKDRCLFEFNWVTGDVRKSLNRSAKQVNPMRRFLLQNVFSNQISGPNQLPGGTRHLWAILAGRAVKTGQENAEWWEYLDEQTRELFYVSKDGQQFQWDKPDDLEETNPDETVVPLDVEPTEQKNGTNSSFSVGAGAVMSPKGRKLFDLSF